ncbi:MAG: glucosaminidase domain-containing protein [Microthrixaceae bacterium]
MSYPSSRPRTHRRALTGAVVAAALAVAASVLAPAVGAQDGPAAPEPTTSASTTTTTTAGGPPNGTGSTSTTSPTGAAGGPSATDPLPAPLDVASIDELVAEARAQAQAVRDAQIAAAQQALEAADALAAEAGGRRDAAAATRDAAARVEEQRRAEVEQVRSRVGAFAADAYMRVGTDSDGRLARLRLGAGAADPKVVDAQQTLVYTDGAVRATRTDLREATGRFDESRRATTAAQRTLDERTAEYDSLASAAAAARSALEELRTAPLDVPAAATVSSLYGSVGPTILGRGLLTPEDLAAFVRARGRPHPSVDVEQLASAFVDEGAAEGVRSDLAWAQSIIETGYFGFAGSMVEPGDHNYAGIGACDSCSRGFLYPTPELGARAQMQLLRTYADRNATTSSLARPLAGRPPEKVGVRGCCATWMALSGVWATGPGYGVKILGLYNDMLRFAVERRRTAAQPPAPPVPPPGTTLPSPGPVTAGG